MNYGRFFGLNNEKSDLSRGIAIYDYLWLEDKEASDALSKYPVYLTITREALDFRVHYHHDDNTGEQHIHRHLHNVILSLPLSPNLDVKDGLTGALVEGYSTNFPIYDNGRGNSNYMYLMLANRIKEAIDKEESKDINYSNLQCFNPSDRDNNMLQELNSQITADYIERIRTEDNDPIDFNKFIRKLILDFLFDLEQTKVFQTSPHYEHVSVKLKENFFFSALAAKANFYYYKKLLLSEIEKNNISTEVTEVTDVLSEYYIKAEKQWTKSIRNPKAPTNFNDYRDHWFDDPEKEMDGVYSHEYKIVKEFLARVETNKTKEEIERCRELSSIWYLKRFKWKTCSIGILKMFHLGIIRYAAAIAAAWLLTLIGSDLLPAYLNDNEIVIDLFSGMHLFVIGFVFYGICYFYILMQIKDVNKRVRIGRTWKRPLIVLAICTFYSMVIGAFMGVFSNKYFIPITICPLSWSIEHEASPLYITGVILSVFIGVVLESVSNKKETTEDL